MDGVSAMAGRRVRVASPLSQRERGLGEGQGEGQGEGEKPLHNLLALSSSKGPVLPVSLQERRVPTDAPPRAMVTCHHA